METLSLKTTKMLAYRENGVGWMVFNNPERLNALMLEMQEAVPVILGSFAEDSDVRVVVITGAGDRAFVSGADISEFDSRRAQPEQIREFNAIQARAAASYKALGKPIIAMVRGFALGGGLLTALRADLRVASEDAQFGVPAARLGLGYEYGNVKAMVELIGAGYTREILLTGARYSAQEAFRMGLVNRVVPSAELESTVKELAATIAANAPLTIRAVREAIDEVLKDKDDRDVSRVDRLVAECFASEDYAEGRLAFREKRPPAFKGR